MSNDNNKETGSFYTPPDLIHFMVEYLKKEKQSFYTVLEPSAGDGRFLSVLLSLSDKITAIEFIKDKVEYMQQHYPYDNVKIEEYDFIQYAMKTDERYSLVIGNPPYINPKVMDKKSLESAKILCENEGLKKTVMQNMWLAFVIGACRVLEPNGSIFFVLPMEFLQVQYAEKLREHLETRFNTIHIISFQERIFENIEQETCLVYLANKEKELPYILYEVYQNPTSQKPLSRNIIKKNKPLKKWSNAVLSDDDILVLQNLSKKFETIEKVGTTAPGIVTGGNKYFILTKEQVRAYRCQNYVMPILQKNSYISENTIIIDDAVINGLKKDGKPVYLLNLADCKSKKLPKKLVNYLEQAGKEEIDGVALKDRYKCANREPWYGVPIVNKGDVIFFKRYHIVPRVYINRAEIHTTDAAYHIRLMPEWDRESFVFCFYNSLTLAQCEFQGRYYGGGVRELVPSEFKSLSVPYHRIDKQDIEKLNQMFSDKVDVEEIVQYVNSKTLALDIEEEMINRLEKIRKQLLEVRNKTR